MENSSDTTNCPNGNTSDSRRLLPSIDGLLHHPDIIRASDRYGLKLTTRVVRYVLDEMRRQGVPYQAPESLHEHLLKCILDRCAKEHRSRARTVFNLTGTVIHTNLGRALLSESAINAMAEVARAPVALEYDLESGQRGDRDDLIEYLLCELTGAEAATVVNNNAAAVLLTLGALGTGREGIVSRGELIEIGGAFRMPDIMEAAGCQLREVGTTNRTHARDYRNAIGENTGLIVKVHPSNYAVTGFTRTVSEAELSDIAHEAGLPLVVDLGSGALTDLARFGVPHELQPDEVIAAGADIVTFSGDKLLGGPQAGIIVGRREYIEKIKRHPLKRALRLDKLVLAALEATLRHYRNDTFPEQALPTLRLLSRTADDIHATGERLLAKLQASHHLEVFDISIEPCLSQIGSGSLPVDRLSSHALVLRPQKTAERSLNALEDWLHKRPRPIIGRLKNGALWLDLRCLETSDEELFLQQWRDVADISM